MKMMEGTNLTITQGKTGPEFLADLETDPAQVAATENFRLVISMAEAVEQAGGVSLLVGGSVRDELLGQPIKDFDLEIYHLPVTEIETIAKQHGQLSTVGQSFAVMKLHNKKNGDIDISLPRRETKSGQGHKGFIVEADPNMSVEAAARRRDFTINALAKNPLTGEILDYFGGLEDLRQKKLRVVDPVTFREDPLRVLRAFQFAGRFELSVDPATMEILRSMMPEVAELSIERLAEEWEKLFMKSSRPSIGLELARQTGYFARFSPEIDALVRTPQATKHHPEGDVWTHSMYVVDGAKSLADKHLAPANRLPAVLGAFLHDLGKGSTTTTIDGEIKSPGHDGAGVEPAGRWLASQGFSEKVIKPVQSLIAEHMRPHALYDAAQAGKLTPGAIRRLLNRLYPASVEQLLVISEADFRGRGPFTNEQGQTYWPTDYPMRDWLIGASQGIVMTEGRPEPLLRGQDLINRGWKPGHEFGAVLSRAEQLAENGWTRDQLLQVIGTSTTPAEAQKKLEAEKT